MGKVTRKRYSADVKARVALEAIRGEQTIAELASKHGVHVTMVAGWKRQAVEGMAGVFVARAEAPPAATEADLTRLHAKIGPLVLERDFLAKASGRRVSIGGVRLLSPDTRCCRLSGNVNLCRSAGRVLL